MNVLSTSFRSFSAVALFLCALCLGQTPSAWADVLTWTNASASGNWNTTDTNWNPALETFDSDGTDDVIFDGTVSGTINVASGMNPQSMTVSGANNYTFVGGPISGGGVLNKSGAGILQFDGGANTFSGGINFGGGEIAYTNLNQLGNSSASFTVTENSRLNFNFTTSAAGGTVSNPVTIDAGKTFTLTRAGNQHYPSYGGKISGDGALRIEGTVSNYWNLTNSTNDFSGGLSIAGGAVISNDGAMGNNSVITVEGGSNVAFNAAVTGIGKEIQLVSGTSTIGTNNAIFHALITGAGTLRANGAWLNNAGNSFAGISMGGIAGGTLRIGVAGSIGAGSVTFDSNPNNTIMFMDSVGGIFNNTLNMSSGSRTLTVNEASAVIQFDGAVNATGAITKNGPGTLAVSNWNSTNTLAVTDGTFLLNDATTTNLHNITVDEAATFGGNGILNMGTSRSVTVDGTLAPGNNGIGTLTVNGALILSETTELQFELGPGGIVGGASNDLIEVNGALVLEGTVFVTDAGGFGEPGSVYRLFNYTGSFIDNGLTLAGSSNAYLDFSVLGQVNLIVPIPEPATLWLVAFPLLVMARKRRRASVK